jgi:hypothetical protein
MATFYNDRDSSSVGTSLGTSPGTLQLPIHAPSSEKAPIEKSPLSNPPDTHLTPHQEAENGAVNQPADGKDLQAPDLPRLRYGLVCTG